VVRRLPVMRLSMLMQRLMALKQAEAAAAVQVRTCGRCLLAECAPSCCCALETAATVAVLVDGTHRPCAAPHPRVQEAASAKAALRGVLQAAQAAASTKELHESAAVAAGKALLAE
jgi:hypothetical protein